MSYYAITSNRNFVSEEELYHYGVLGMKWGVRHDPQKAYERASKKLRRLDTRASKAIEKAYKTQAKADRKADSLFSSESGIAKADEKARTAMRKSVAKVQKARKWMQKMEKVFQDTPVKMSQEQIEIGKKYTEILNNRAFGR